MDTYPMYMLHREISVEITAALQAKVILPPKSFIKDNKNMYTQLARYKIKLNKMVEVTNRPLAQRNKMDKH